MKLVTMGNEIFRRIRNSSRQLTTEARFRVLQDFIDKLHKSGYSKSTIAGIITLGLKCYFRKLTIDLEGGPPVNQRDHSKKMRRRREKMGAKNNCYNRKRGGNQELKDHGWRKTPP